MSEHLYGTARDAPAVQRGIGGAHGIVPLEAVYPAFGATDGQKQGDIHVSERHTDPLWCVAVIKS